MREGSADRWQEFARELVHRIGQARLAKGYTQEQLAAAVGLSPGAYRRLEEGGSDQGGPVGLSLHTLLALCHALDARLEDLLPGWWLDVEG